MIDKVDEKVEKHLSTFAIRVIQFAMLVFRVEQSHLGSGSLTHGLALNSQNIVEAVVCRPAVVLCRLFETVVTQRFNAVFNTPRRCRDRSSAAVDLQL
eukprot:SAG11_NODE_4457_length_1888_cov_2.001118_2_plen_98_part_00